MKGSRDDRLIKRATNGVVTLLILLAVILAVSSWSLNFWQGWIYWLIFATAVIAITVYLAIRDPSLLERRLDAGPAAERETSQKIIQTIAGLVAVGFIIVPGIDHRLGWSNVPPYLIAVGDILVGFGFLMVFLVFRHNSFTSAIITVDRDQPVISTGPYAFVRHPMYAAALVIFLGTPIALGSAWGLLLLPPITGVIIRRLLAEEAYLVRNLQGYEAYRHSVRWRLIPHLW
jgi:protein-S-isoprenylcysteine O-methyltransferase Ste14